MVDLTRLVDTLCNKDLAGLFREHCKGRQFVREGDSSVMAKIVIAIRTVGEMTQEDFSQEVKTTTATVNRWENQKAYPSNLALRGLLEWLIKKGRDYQKEVYGVYKQG